MNKETYKQLLKGDDFEKQAVDLKEHTVFFQTQQNSDKVERTVVLCHGASGSASYMSITANEIIKTMPNTKVILLDLPFHRHSIPSENNQVNVHYYTLLVEEFLQSLKEAGELQGILQWLGWSMGGSIGLLLDLRKNVKIDELTLLCSSPVWNTIEGLLQIPVFTDKHLIVDTFKGIILNDVKDLDEGIVETIADLFNDIRPSGKVMVEDFKAILPDKYNVVDKLKNVTAKTFICAGLQDELALPELQKVMNENINNSKLLMLDDGHSLLLKPKFVQELVKELNEFYTN